MGKLTSGLLGIFLLLALPRAEAVPIQLVTNGGFETGGGSFTGWTVTDLAGGSGSFFINPNDGLTPAPLSGSGGALAFNPAGGSSFAVTDQTGPGTHALTQTVVVPTGASSVLFSFDMFMNDFSGVNPTVDPLGLDHTGPANQHARIEILTAAAAIFSTSPADIIASILAPAPTPSLPGGINPWISSPIFDLTAALGGGGSFQIRFAETDNSGFLTLGVDNVSLIADVTAVPLPPTALLFGLGLFMLGIRSSVLG